MKKKNLPKYIHRLRRKYQKNIAVALLGCDFCDSKEARMIEPYLELKDEKISITVYAINNPDDITARLKGNLEDWYCVPNNSASEIADSIFDKKIDILIALSDNKIIREILELHAAPVQIAGANALTLKDAFDKNNAPYVDIILGDNFIVASNGIETIKLKSAFCYSPFFGNANIKIKENNDEIIFGAMYNENDKRLPIWKNFSRILTSVPNSKLKLFSDCFEDEKNKIVAKKRLAWAEIPEEKIETFLIKDSDSFDYLSDIDIFLDKNPNGENITILDALYIGIPVVSSTEVGKSILNSAGLSELAANDDNSYINAAVAIGNDGEIRTALKNGLRNMMKASFLMNKDDFLNTLKSSIFAAFDYLLSLSDNIPTEEEVKILWEVLYDSTDCDDIKFALMDRILLSKPTDPEILNFISVMLARDKLENIRDALQYIPKDSLTEKFCKLVLVNREKKWDLAEKLAIELRDTKANSQQEEYILSTAVHVLADIYKATGRFRESAETYLECERRTPLKNKSNIYERYSNYLLMLHYTDATPKEMFEAAKKYAGLFKNIVKFTHYKRENAKIKVGYISADFRNHVVANFACAFFQARNKNRFETFAYMTKPEDSNTNLFKQIADNYRDVHKLKYEEIAQTIYDDKIDILVELGGHTGENPLPILAIKPAPIQLSGIGYFSTTGLPEVDYFIVDEHTAPEGEDEFFTEKLLRLKHSHFCMTHTKMRPHVLEEIPFERHNYITFGSMNKTDKVTDTVLETWKKIMERVPNSRLFLKYGTYDDPWRVKNEKERMARIGFDLNRVDFEGFSHLYLNRYNAMDIALDTFPYPGGGTTCDALLMNVPVVTLSGNSNHERFGKSILENIGLSGLVAYNLEEYVDIAVNLANDIPRLKKLHGEIFERMKHSAIMDQSIYMADLEEAYEKIYANWLNG